MKIPINSAYSKLILSHEFVSVKKIAEKKNNKNVTFILWIKKNYFPLSEYQVTQVKEVRYF